LSLHLNCARLVFLLLFGFSFGIHLSSIRCEW
jgi:hypothetical protein